VGRPAHPERMFASPDEMKFHAVARLHGLWLLAGLLVPQVAEAEMIGRATVVDGDTIEIHGERMRLHGIDAPESSQWCLDERGARYRCGQHAALALADRIGAGNVRCDLFDRDRYDRHIARCFQGRADLNRWMVLRGQAVAYRRYSTKYASVEARARGQRIGIWQGAFDLPWDWRRGSRTVTARGAAAPAAPPSPDCAIKGNISRNGRIYHVPGQTHYDRTTIRPEKGERWFCSEAEARAAGWRRAEA
jgi:endonuclease YncB( thermonuclease family)